MNAPFRHARFTLGSIALLALATACSKESRPAREPSPTFESRIGESTAPAPNAQDVHEHGAMGTMPGVTPGQTSVPREPGAIPPSQSPGVDRTPMPGSSTDTSLGAPSGSTPDTGAIEPMINEREMCDELKIGVNMRIDNVQEGAAIVITPKTGTDLAVVRERAQKIERLVGMINSGNPSGEGSGTTGGPTA